MSSWTEIDDDFGQLVLIHSTIKTCLTQKGTFIRIIEDDGHMTEGILRAESEQNEKAVGTLWPCPGSITIETQNRAIVQIDIRKIKLVSTITNRELIKKFSPKVCAKPSKAVARNSSV